MWQRKTFGSDHHMRIPMLQLPPQNMSVAGGGRVQATLAYGAVGITNRGDSKLEPTWPARHTAKKKTNQ